MVEDGIMENGGRGDIGFGEEMLRKDEDCEGRGGDIFVGGRVN